MGNSKSMGTWSSADVGTINKIGYVRRPEAVEVEIFEDGTVVFKTTGRLDPDATSRPATPHQLAAHLEKKGMVRR